MSSKNDKPLILLSNDDGVHAPGIRALREELRRVADVITVAPSGERSGQSQAITISHPLRLHEQEEGVYSVDGTPADCIMLAMQHMLEKDPDWVISGINRGGNLGTDILYSGTVGAAMEGCINGVKAMAVSLEGVDKQPLDYSAAARIARYLVEKEDVIQLQPYEMLNVNVPNFPFEKILGIRTAKVGRRIYEGKMWERHDPRGQSYFWVGGSGYGHEQIPGSDCVVLNEGYVTLSVLKCDFYASESTNALNERINSSFGEGLDF